MLTDEYKVFVHAKTLEGGGGLLDTLVLDESCRQHALARINRLQMEMEEAMAAVAQLQEQIEFLREEISQRNKDRLVLPFEGEGNSCE